MQLPVAIDDFKKLCGRWTTGVTIVTARSGDLVHGMTVSAFTEVSLSPPLVRRPMIDWTESICFPT